MTLTLEIPEDLALRLASMPESERTNFAIAALWLQSVDEAPVDETTQARMVEGLAQIDAGATVGWDDYMSQRRLARQNRASL